MTVLCAIKVPETLPPDVFEKLLTFLDSDSQARIRRFYHQEDAIRSLFGRIAPIWYLLDTGLLPRPFLPFLKFGEEGNQKPIIVEPGWEPRIEYNVSHDGEYVLFGTTRGTKIGVDIMSIPSSPDELEEALFDQMTISEKRDMRIALSPKERAERLAKLWVVKEAYVKAIGEGIVFGLQRINVNLADDGTLMKVTVDGKTLDETGWSAYLGTLDNGYIWACVTESSEIPTQPKIVPYQQIIDVMQS